MNVIINGYNLILVDQEDAAPRNKAYVGGVPLRFADGTSTTVRVYGEMPRFTGPKDQASFEKKLRAFCKSPEFTGPMYELEGPPPHAVRFNESMILRLRRWHKPVNAPAPAVQPAAH